MVIEIKVSKIARKQLMFLVNCNMQHSRQGQLITDTNIHKNTARHIFTHLSYKETVKTLNFTKIYFIFFSYCRSKLFLC